MQRTQFLTGEGERFPQMGASCERYSAGWRGRSFRTWGRALVVSLLISLFLLTLAVDPPAGATPYDGEHDGVFSVIPRLHPLNDAAIALLGPIILKPLPLAVRFNLQLSVALYSCWAACHPTALNFFAHISDAPSNMCEDDHSLVNMAVHAITRTLEREWPTSAGSYAAFAKTKGFQPWAASMNVNTSAGFGNAVGTELAEYFAEDGWNSIGDMTNSRLRRPFKDTTGYTPENMPLDGKRPLRWEPEVTTDGEGSFTAQMHAVPFLNNVNTMVLNAADVASRSSPNPYEHRNWYMAIHHDDSALLEGLFDELFGSAASDAHKRFLARWWDNKLLSMPAFSAVYGEALVWGADEDIIWNMGQALALHDAVVVAWREKLRVDVARPSSMAKYSPFKDTWTVAYGVPEGAWVNMKYGEWEPLLPNPPYSEYPSASACLCRAFADHADLRLRNFNDNLTIPFHHIFQEGAFAGLFPMEGDAVVSFLTPLDAGESCRDSRLWGGVNFSPALDEGWELCQGIGQAAFDHVEALLQGTAPAYCGRCEL